MSRVTVAGVLAAVLLVSGCASAPAEPRHIDITYRVERNEPLSEDSPCVWIRDSRARKAFYGTQVSSEEAMEWLGKGVEGQLRAKTRVTDSIEPDKGLLVELQKAYVNPIDVTLSGVVVIKVVWGERQTVYRGQEVQMHWWGAEDEIGRTMSAALDNALQKINFPIVTSTCDPAHEYLPEPPAIL